MPYLDNSNRRLLENAVLSARDAAEAAATTALNALAVSAQAPHQVMTPEQRKLRVVLRAQMRRLGGFEDLVQACAYEQWHRMLFARFLAENSLLLHPEYGTITLEECVELAREQGIADPWDLAAQYASEMLPGIFRPDDPLLQVKLAPEGREALERILEGIPACVFTSDDGLGWVYQYWQANRKDEVNRAERKIEGADICAVTQLFTEPYMVRFLLQNTLGAWWLHLHPESPLRARMEFYKPEVQHDFAAWPDDVDGLRVLDPCCGSGHFLVEAYKALLAMYREQNPDASRAALAVRPLANLFGLELDPRCTQIAAFALALAAWKAGAPHEGLPVPNIACCGLPMGATVDQWKDLASGDAELADVMGELHELFANARDLGSLIDPAAAGMGGLFRMDQARLMPHLERALSRERSTADPASAVFGEAARGALRALDILTGQYHLVITNPPFLLTSKAGDVLREFCARTFPEAKKDLATCFVERCRAFACAGGQYALVNPQNWLFLTGDRKLREKMLKEQTWEVVARLGPHAFETITGEVVQVALLVFGDRAPTAEHCFVGIDASAPKKPGEKAEVLREAAVGGEAA